MIPLLRSIYEKMGEKLDMVYISIDEPATIEQWPELLKKEQIPWRSLTAGDQVKEVRRKYKVESIPLIYLVRIDKKIEKLELRDNKTLNYLYSVYDTQN